MCNDKKILIYMKNQLAIILTFALFAATDAAFAFCVSDEPEGCRTYREILEKCRKNSGPSWDCSKDYQVKTARLAAEKAIFTTECETLYNGRRRLINICVNSRGKKNACIVEGNTVASCDNTENIREAIDTALKEIERAQPDGAIEREEMCGSRSSEKGKRECAEATKTMRECILEGDTEKECRVQPNVKYGFELADKADIAQKFEEIRIAEAKASEARARRPGVKIGMTEKQVIEKTSWGAPEKVNRTTSASGVREQWVFGGGNYLYFTNGRLTAIQN